MAISKNTQANIDDSNLAAYPNGQVKDDDGTGDGFPLIRVTTSDIYEFFDKLMRLAALTFNGDFDNETNGYQFVSAIIALASKSDYILPLTTVASILQLPTNLDILQTNEKLIVQAIADWTDEVQIKGSTATLLTVTITRQYKAGDYLMMRRTVGGVTLVCIITADNLNLVVSENAYLKAANNAETLAGAIITKAVTPASFLYAFNLLATDDADSVPYLVTESNNGLMSAADKIALDAVVNPVKNVGSFSGINPGSGTIGSFAPRTKDVVSAEITAVNSGGAGSTTYLVTLANSMPGAYFVRSSMQSDGTVDLDNDLDCPVFRRVSDTTFTWSINGDQPLVSAKSLTAYIEVVDIS